MPYFRTNIPVQETDHGLPPHLLKRRDAALLAQFSITPPGTPLWTSQESSSGEQVPAWDPKDPMPQIQLTSKTMHFHRGKRLISFVGPPKSWLEHPKLRQNNDLVATFETTKGSMTRCNIRFNGAIREGTTNIAVHAAGTQRNSYQDVRIGSLKPVYPTRIGDKAVVIHGDANNIGMPVVLVSYMAMIGRWTVRRRLTPLEVARGAAQPFDTYSLLPTELVLCENI